MKKKSLAKLKKDVWKVFSVYIRLRDCLKTTGSLEYGECVSCPTTKPFAQLDAGHYVPKKGGNYFSERGVNAQCRSCNRYHSGNQLEYRREVIRRYGEGADVELEEEAKQIKQWKRDELEEMITKYQQAILKLKDTYRREI